MARSGDRKYASVPVQIATLAMLSDDVRILFELRWTEQEQEHEWETKALAEHPNDGDTAERQQALAYELCSHWLVSEQTLSSMVCIVGEDLSKAVDPAERRSRPHPYNPIWWHQCGGLSHKRFVHLSREEVARARELLADASRRAQRLTLLAEDIEREIGPVSADPTVAYSTPVLLERLRRAQRLADAIFLPLHPLKRLFDHHLVSADDPRHLGRRSRRRAATPPRAAAAAAASPLAMIRRSESI